MAEIVIFQHEPDDPPGVIAEALEELQMPFGVRRLDLGEPLPEPSEVVAVVVMGGYMHVTQGDQFPFIEPEIAFLRDALAAGTPIWGVCLGAQLLTVAAGGEVYRRATPEIGWVEIEKAADDPLLEGVASPFFAYEWHLYSCALAPEARLIADGSDGVQVFRAGERAWGTQFHPEVDEAMIENWIVDEKDLETKDPELAATMRRDTARYVAANDGFCRRLTRNFLLASGALAADS